MDPLVHQKLQNMHACYAALSRKSNHLAVVLSALHATFQHDMGSQAMVESLGNELEDEAHALLQAAYDLLHAVESRPRFIRVAARGTNGLERSDADQDT